MYSQAIVRVTLGYPSDACGKGNTEKVAMATWCPEPHEQLTRMPTDSQPMSICPMHERVQRTER